MAQPPQREGDRPRGERPEGDRPRGDRPEGDRGSMRGDRPEGDRGGMRGGFQNPMMTAIDTDNDGELSAAEISNASKALKTLDKDGDGKISREEMRPTMTGPMSGGAGAGFSTADMMTRMMQADTNKDGKISKEEAPERMRDGFDRIDTNSDGFLDKAEMEAMAQRFQGMQRGGGDRPQGGRPSGRDGGTQRPEGSGRPISRDDL